MSANGTDKVTKSYKSKHMTKTYTALVFVLSCSGNAVAQAEVTFDWAIVGNPNNAGDVQSQGTFGAVDHVYRISKYEVTNAQYTEFLNAVDSIGTNPNSVYNSFMGSDLHSGIAFNARAASGSKYSTKRNLGNKPVNWVSNF
jgi:formylglycine-generating enzyme required for sulfatase activity